MSRSNNSAVAVTVDASAACADWFVPIASAVATTDNAAADTIVASSATKSDKIRQLLAIGMKRGDVAKLLNIRYQHVRNVELMPLKRK